MPGSATHNRQAETSADRVRVQAISASCHLRVIFAPRACKGVLESCGWPSTLRRAFGETPTLYHRGLKSNRLGAGTSENPWGTASSDDRSRSPSEPHHVIITVPGLEFVSDHDKALAFGST
jgi:hypothetical protein